MIDFVLGLVAFCLGAVIFYAGYRWGSKRKPEAVAPRELTEEEKERNKAYADAYSQWLSYSANQAYGLTPKKEK